MSGNNIKLSILDQSIVRKGGNPTDALNQTLAVAQLADKLGYTRFWVSEHHNMAAIAGSAPEILMVKLADATKHIRIGSGGIMLPNHSALKVAENFRLLEALFPNRIDLGMGRAPGGDRTSSVLLNPANDFSEDSYLQQLDYLQLFLTDTAGTEQGQILAIPKITTSPQQWMLSSSGGSSQTGAKYGMGLAVAKFINGQVQPDAVETYKQNFISSDQFEEPIALLAIIVLCADTAEKAYQLQKCLQYQFTQMEKGNFEGISSYEEIKNYNFNLFELERIKANSGRMVVGTPDMVKEQLTQLARDFGVTEIMATTMAYHLEDRLRSFELLAEAFNLNNS